MTKDKNYITPKGHEKLCMELERLTKVERPEVTKTVAWAASNGDRSENADYIYGKKRLREIDSRIRFLTKRLDNAEVVDPCKMNTAKVQFGAKVKVCDEEGIEKTFTIVGVDETDTKKGHISYKSPIGAGLLGKEAGDVALIKGPQKTFELEILDVMYGEIL